MSFDGWQLGLIDEAGYNGIRPEHIEKVARELEATGLCTIDYDTFESACRRCGIDSDNFTQADLDSLEERLNR